MENFYAPPSAFRNDLVVLPEDEARHAGKVLRKQAGDEIVVVDGEGGWHLVRLDHVDKHAATGYVVETRQEVGEPGYALTLGLALLKNQNRFETFLEKAVELGVGEVVPMLTARTEKGRLKERRAHNILVAAMKQSGRSRLIRLVAPQPFASALEAPSDLSLICHERVDASSSILNALQQHRQARRLQVLVGPEGGFTQGELRQAEAAHFAAVSLGPRRLRAETAALVAATAIMLTLA